METEVENGRGPSAVRAEGLVKHYTGRGGTVEAVRGVDLHVEAGEVFGFLGPNGAGKSTTVRMLTTLLSLTGGSACVAGLDVAREPDAVRRRIGVALQEAGLDPRQTGRELLVLQGRLFDLSAREAAERAAELLELVELTDAADRRVKGYSGGMKRRLDLASALVHEPEVLFLDEPTTGLDPASRVTVWDEVRRINERGTTVFLTTQYLEEADQLCDRLAIIAEGRIVPGSSTEFLHGQGYGAFQLPSSMLLAASFGSAALFLVEEIEGGYFDKLRATPVSRSAIVLGRLIAEGTKALVLAGLIVLLGLAFGITIASGVLGFVLLVLLSALWAVVYAGFLQVIALKTRSAAATNSAGLIFFPLLFLTPNFVPRNLLTRPMEIAATANPVTYVMEALRSLILVHLRWETIGLGYLVVVVAAALMLAVSVRVIRTYD